MPGETGFTSRGMVCITRCAMARLLQISILAITRAVSVKSPYRCWEARSGWICAPALCLKGTVGSRGRKTENYLVR